MDERSAGQAGADIRPWPRAAAGFARGGPWTGLRGGRSWIPSAASQSRSAAGTGRSSLELAGAAVRIEGGPVILDGLSFDVAPGERLAVVGPNGAGKTTLLRLLSGRVALSSGAVRVGGADVGRLSFAERARRIAIVVQNDVPDLRLTVADYVALGRIPHRGRATPAEDRRIVDRALDRVGLADFGARRLDGLSGGERQRSAIARAVAQDPQVLLLDEPTNHLDPRARADMLALARDLGVTVVAVLHDLGLVRSFADRVAILDRGRLVAIGPPEAALTPGTVRAVFGMDCFSAVNPATGRTVLVFDAPSR